MFCSVDAAVAPSPSRRQCHLLEEGTVPLCKVSARVWGAAEIPEEGLLASPASGVGCGWGRGGHQPRVPCYTSSSGPREGSGQFPVRLLPAGASGPGWSSCSLRL